MRSCALAASANGNDAVIGTFSFAFSTAAPSAHANRSRGPPPPAAGASVGNAVAPPPPQPLHALQGGQAGGAAAARLLEIEQRGHVPNVWRRYRHILGVEAALRVGEVVGVDAVAQLEAAHVRADFRYRAAAVGAQDQRKGWP